MAEIKDREYIEIQHLQRIDEKGIKYWSCEDVGDLIRCKDCKHYNNGFCESIDGLTGAVKKADYCSRGEKK